jgi:hypothetical protein
MPIAARRAPSVAVSTVARLASGLVFLLSALSFVVWATTGFAFVFPPMSILICGLSALFYVISFLLERQWRT